jgi:hypothetical protein
VLGVAAKEIINRAGKGAAVFDVPFFPFNNKACGVLILMYRAGNFRRYESYVAGADLSERAGRPSQSNLLSYENLRITDWH